MGPRGLKVGRGWGFFLVGGRLMLEGKVSGVRC